MEGDPAAKEHIDRLESTDFVDAYGDFQALLRVCLSKPVLSKLNMITKTTSEKVKRRLIMD